MFLVFLIFYILPFLLLIGLLPSSQSLSVTESSIVLNSVVSSVLFVGASIIWLYFVNNLRLKDIMSYLKLTAKDLDTAFLWGFAVFMVILSIQIAIAMVLFILDVHIENPVAEEIAGTLSITSMVFVSIVQSTSEEIFFRGFLLEKIGEYSGYGVAIGATAFLFGLAHMGYGQVYPILMPIVMGILLGYVVVKTKNLFSSITAHVTFNLVTFVVYIISQSLQSSTL